MIVRKTRNRRPIPSEIRSQQFAESKILGAEIKKRIKEKGLLQGHVAKRVGKSVSHFNSLLNGGRVISGRMKKVIEAFLDETF